MSLVFKQFEDPETNTYTYFVGDSASGECALIDSVREHMGVYEDFLTQGKWNLKYLMETHVHADHVTANASLKKIYPNAQIVLSEKTQAQCQSLKLKEGEMVYVGNIPIQSLATPGHTPDSITLFVNGDRVLTGDCLFINSCGRTDFQSGNSHEQYHSLKKLAALPPETLVYPGHDYNNRHVSNIAEQLKHNPQMKHVSAEAFCADLESWKLPPPKKIKQSVPGNLKCGE